jgi:hypothetical protein
LLPTSLQHQSMAGAGFTARMPAYYSLGRGTKWTWRGTRRSACPNLCPPAPCTPCRPAALSPPPWLSATFAVVVSSCCGRLPFPVLLSRSLLVACTHSQAQGLNKLSNVGPILPLLDLHWTTRTATGDPPPPGAARPELYKKVLQLLRTRLIKKLEHITEVTPPLPPLSRGAYVAAPYA